tara:strand:+ start:197 stop:475 length:279 start_codon:yes stop_codon:yes gene_type:complete
MSLKNIRDNFNKVKEESGDYSSLLKEKKEIDTEVKTLKNKYKEGGVGKEVFSQYNKKLSEIESKLKSIKEKVGNLSKKISEEIDTELQDVVG